MCSETCYLITQTSWAEGSRVQDHPELEWDIVSNRLTSFKIEKSWWGPELKEILKAVLTAWPSGGGDGGGGSVGQVKELF